MLRLEKKGQLLAISVLLLGTLLWASSSLAAGPIEQAKLTASDVAEGDEFGNSVALSGDTALVGAYGDDDAGSFSGSAYVFTRSGTSWTEQAKLIPSDAAAGDRFGWSVAISGDTALIGAYGDDSFSGSAYIFMRSGTSWTQQAKLTATDAATGDRFGWSVAISGDTALIGAYGDDSSSGSAYIFTRSGTSWTQQAKLTATDAAVFDDFGWSVTISDDTALVGARGDDDAGSFSGSAYIFTRSGTSWIQQVKLTASDAAFADRFGWSVAISGDTALVGAILDDPGTGFRSGSVYIFTGSSASWIQQAKITASDAASSDEFGYSVAISGDTAWVGAPGNDDDSGSAYILTRSGTSWTEQAKLTGRVPLEFDEFGESVAVSGDTALVGAPGEEEDDTNNGFDSGSAYVFASSTPEEQIDALKDDVQALVDSGALNGGQGNALTNKLDSALKQLEKGNIQDALNKLQALIDQVNNFINDGVLTSEEGQPLIDAANSIIDAIAQSSATGLSYRQHNQLFLPVINQ